MAQKDVLAASKTMLRAIEARRLALVPSARFWSLWPAGAESVRALAAIYRESGRSVKEVAEFLEMDLRFLTKEGKGLAPGDLRSPYKALESAYSMRTQCKDPNQHCNSVPYL